MGLRMRLEWPVMHMVRLPNDMLLLAYIVKKKKTLQGSTNDVFEISSNWSVRIPFSWWLYFGF